MDLKYFIIFLLASVFVNGVLAGVYKFFINKIGNSPLRKHEVNIEEIKSLKSHELQIDSYYRDISIKQVSYLIERWYLLAFDTNEILTNNEKKNIKILKEATNDTIAYGSKETIRRLAIFQNYNYEHHSIQEVQRVEDKGTNKDLFVAMYLISYIISSLKKDFTGEDIDPEDLLKIKLTDYNDNKEMLLYAHNKAKESLNI